MAGNEVIFVKMREMLIPHYYMGYADAFQLAELSGYKTIWLDELDPDSDNTYILTPLNGSWHNGWQSPKAQIILFDLEWRVKEGGFGWEKADFEIPPGISRVWASDKWYASLIGAEYVPLGSHPNLVGHEKPDNDKWDCAILACLSQDGGRQHIFDTLLQADLKIAPNCWNPARDSVLKSSAVMLHTHQWRKVKTIAPLRYAIAAAYGMPLISEPVEDASIFDGSVLFCEPEYLPSYMKTLVNDFPVMLADKGAALHELLCEQYSFRKCIEGAV